MTTEKVTSLATATKPANLNQESTTKPASASPAKAAAPKTPAAPKSAAASKPTATKKKKTARKKAKASAARKPAKSPAQKPAAKATSAAAATAKKAASSFFTSAKNAAPAQTAQFKKAADQATRTFNDAFAQSNEQVQACMECGNITADAAKAFTNEWMRFTNESFSDNMEISKDMFTCRTINDMFDLQSKLIRSNLDHFFNQSVKFSEMMFQYASDAAEPVNETIASTTKKFNKTFAA